MKEWHTKSMNISHKCKNLRCWELICNIGCGCGRNLIYYTKYVKKLIGIDLSKRSLDFAKEYVNSDNLELIQGDNLEVTLDDNIADLLISDGVVHHKKILFKHLTSV